MDLNRVERTDNHVPCRNALISVADKNGIPELAQQLWSINPDLVIYSSGGTYKTLAEYQPSSKALRSVSEYTGQPEMQGGLVKTLDYRIYLGLLSETYNTAHQKDLRTQGAIPFDLVICNFYPFEQIATQEGVRLEDLRTHIDIGGPTMLRAAAKNFLRVTAIHDPEDYESLLEELRETGGTTLPFRANLAAKAFQYTSRYENTIAGALGSYILHASWESAYSTEEQK